MADNEFNFYNSENDGYRGGFGDYADPSPAPVPGPAGPGPESPRKRPGRFTKRAIALLLACVVVGGAAGAGGAAAYQQFAKPDTVVYQGERPTVDVDTVANSNGGQPMTPEQLYAANLASCVGITVSTTSVNIFGQTTTSAASGSGFVLTQDGYIVTNYHVIEDAVDDSSVSIEVSFADGTQYTATLVGGEQDNDVAVLKIDATGLQPVTLGDSDQLVVGETVYTIGNPLGELTWTMTNGIISALNREINTDGNPQNMIQTNAAINSGNSGGPLFDMDGNVIGVTSAKFSGSTSSGTTIEGLGFAIPINDALRVAYDLVEYGYVKGAYLGVSLRDLDSNTANYYSLPVGPRVEEVVEGSCAEKAGVQVGDIIIRFNGVDVETYNDLSGQLKKLEAGDTVEMVVYRNGEEITLTVTLDEKPQTTETTTEDTQAQDPNQGSQMPTIPDEFQDFWNYFGN